METTNSILCVGRNQRNQELLSQVLIEAGYAVEVAMTCEDLAVMGKQHAISLVLLDIAGFDARIWQSCQELRARAVPLFIIAPPDSAHLPTCHAPGSPFLVKPLAVSTLLAMVAHTLNALP